MSSIFGGSPVSIGYIRGATAATTFSLPAGCSLKRVFVKNNNANAITGGLKFGTTLGGVDVVAALAVGANAVVDSAVLLSLMGGSASTIYVDAVTAWNSANVDIGFEYVKIF